MAENEKNSWEVTKAEYDNANSQYGQYSGLRRQDMAFVTTVQAAALTIIDTKLLALDAPSFLLSIIAFFVLLLGLNTERRLAKYMVGNLKRVKQIELEQGMTRSTLVDEKLEKGWTLPNSKVFPLYYSIFILVWMAIWILNLGKRLT